MIEKFTFGHTIGYIYCLLHLSWMKEWNLQFILAFFPSNVLTYIKSIPIPSSPIEDNIFLGFFSKW